MNEVFQREWAGKDGVEGCWSPFGKTRGLQLSLLLWMLRKEKGLSDSQLAASRLVICPNQLDHMPFTLSKCAYLRKSRGDKSVSGLCIRIYKFVLYTKKVHSPELSVPCIYTSVKREKHNVIDLRAEIQMLVGTTFYSHIHINPYLCTHTWGLRSIPSLVRRQKVLACHQHMSCHRYYQNLPWSFCPRTLQLCEWR